MVQISLSGSFFQTFLHIVCEWLAAQFTNRKAVSSLKRMTQEADISGASSDPCLTGSGTNFSFEPSKRKFYTIVISEAVRQGALGNPGCCQTVFLAVFYLLAVGHHSSLVVNERCRHRSVNLE